MPLIFEQTKDRNRRRSWFIFPHDKTGIHIGRIVWTGADWTLQTRTDPVTYYTARQLRDIAEFLEALEEAR